MARERNVTHRKFAANFGSVGYVGHLSEIHCRHGGFVGNLLTTWRICRKFIADMVEVSNILFLSEMATHVEHTFSEMATRVEHTFSDRATHVKHTFSGMATHDVIHFQWWWLMSDIHFPTWRCMSYIHFPTQQPMSYIFILLSYINRMSGTGFPTIFNLNFL